MSKQVSDLTVEEFKSLLREEIQAALHEVREGSPTTVPYTQRPPLDIPILDVGLWPESLELISREEMYGDEGR